MRFTADGPSIPHELLNARDDGRVVFFCGAGVSMGAGLPNFFTLADNVIERLNAPLDSDACKVLQKARELGEELSITGLISADRVFSLLARDFTEGDIQSAVAKSLAPKTPINDSAHAILLRLARTPDSRIQLVTTNFDRLFESADPEVQTFQPPELPNPSKYGNLNGVVYLHGRTSNDYTRADGSGLVLSSSDFGHAYLSNGWASDFFREVVRKFIVVFVGYSADDPPMHYMLEGLHRTPDEPRHIYALQADESDETIARWRHKGVRAIPYSHANRHSALWMTLTRWAERADDPLRWRQAVIENAMSGPENLEPYERGQVAHVVSTYEGARDFAERLPPSECLCVFDSLCRYASPERSNWLDSESPLINPFTIYGLDSDAAPTRDPQDNRHVSNETPRDAWDAFAPNKQDLANPTNGHFSELRGADANYMPLLPRRLAHLGIWIAKALGQLTTAWWAARQQALHPSIQQRIQQKLEQDFATLAPAIRDTWSHLLEAWRHPNENSRRDWYEFDGEITREGWTSARLREFVRLTCPHIQTSRSWGNRSAPPQQREKVRARDIIRFEVECPVPSYNGEIPDQWLEAAIGGLRENIRLAIRLCQEVGDWKPNNISPIVPDPSPDISQFSRSRELSGVVLHFSSLFKRLLQLDSQAALREFSSWPTNDDTAFCRLRIWASGIGDFLPSDIAAQTLNGVSNEAFWNHRHQRDLLLALAARWRELPSEERLRLERRVVEGPARWEDEDDSAFFERRARCILERIEWLASQQCEFSFDKQKKVAELRQIAPNWKPEYAPHAVASLETRGGSVSINRDHKPLLYEPIASILAKAEAMSGRDERNFLKEYDPFDGLCAARPLRAYLALARAARQSKFPAWAWRTFLNSSARENDEPRLRASISQRICRFSTETAASLLHASTYWLKRNTQALTLENPAIFDATLRRLIQVLESPVGQSTPSDLAEEHHTDWSTEALNAPVGHLAMAILTDERIIGEPNASCGDIEWFSQLERLLLLPSSQCCHAITILSHHLGWFFQLDPAWTREHLISAIEVKPSKKADAFWSGFFWNPKFGSKELFLTLKPSLLGMIGDRERSPDGYVQSLAYITLDSWITTNNQPNTPLVSDSDFRGALLRGEDEFRSQVLWYLERAIDAGDSESDPENDVANEWIPHIQRLLRDVWPIQRAVKTPAMSMRLLELATASVTGFAALSDLTLPLLDKIDNGQGLHLTSAIHRIIEKHALEVLRMLNAVLPEDVSNWPFRTHDLLERIANADSELRNDTQFLSLMLRWNAR